MNFKFNTAQLSRPQRENLMEVLDVLQNQNKNELEITPVEFPQKLMVKLDGDIGMLLGWDVDKQSYAGLTKPEPIVPESKKDTVDLPKPEPEPEPASLPAIELSEISMCAEALARGLVKLSKPLNMEQRIEVWIKFCIVLSEELWK